MNSRIQSAAITTGGGRDIGRAITLRLALEQAVVVVGRTEAGLSQVCVDVLASGLALPGVGDVADPGTATASLALVQAQGLSLKYLVCSAGIGKSGASARLHSYGLARALTRALALEYRKRGLTVAALCPGLIERDMTMRSVRGVMRRQELTENAARERIVSCSPAGSILPAEGIAAIIALLGAQDLAAARAGSARCLLNSQFRLFVCLQTELVPTT